MRNVRALLDQIRESALQLLTCNDQVGLMKQSVDQLYGIYCSLSEVTINNQNDSNIFLPSGKAISPAEAAHCLLEMKRTAIFIRGIHQAIQCKIEQKGMLPIHILYAGTGPYATLITPLLPFLTPDQVQIDFIDINPTSLQSAVSLIQALGLDSFVKDVYCTDATFFKVEKSYDIVISETMQAALKKEPQVAIMQNLIPQVPSNSIFIPEAITVSAALTSRGHWNTETYLMEDIQRIDLGNIFTVDKQHLAPANLRNELTVPDELNDCTQFSLYTDIQVYGTHFLGENDCSLNMPLKLKEMDCSGGEIISFWYEQGEVPGICCQIKGNDKICRAIGRKDWQRTDMQPVYIVEPIQYN